MSGVHSDRLISALAGGWVADAASLGLHWLYDAERVREVGGEQPEFLTPSAEYFSKGFGYFAHEGKRAGDVSHYGAATGVLIDSLVASDGQLDVRDYQHRFRQFFGPGGEWRGFIDNPTRITLENLTRIEHQAIERALTTTQASLTDKQQRVLVQKVLPYTRHLSGERLVEPVRRAIALSYQDEAILEAGVHLAQGIDAGFIAESGADDTQLPAVSKLAPLVACQLGQAGMMEAVEQAVRVTNHSDEAVAWAHCAARLLHGLFEAEALADALEAAMQLAPDPDTLRKACGGSCLNAVRAGERFGQTCYLHEAMPVVFHIVQHAERFSDAVRANILCGGDSCGRAWLVGPALAARFGVGGERGIPLSWLTMLSDGANRLKQIETLGSPRQSGLMSKATRRRHCR